MTRTPVENGMIQFELDQNDIESAIRAFICACHPDVATGKVIDPDPNGDSDYLRATFLAK